MSEDVMLEREAKRLGKTVTQLRMEMATPDAWFAPRGRWPKGISQSQSMITSRPEPTSLGGRIWVSQSHFNHPQGSI